MIDYQGQMVMDFSPAHKKGQKTSQATDETIEKMKATHCQKVYTAIRNGCNGGTAREIAAKIRMDSVEVTRRLNDLVENDYIQRSLKRERKCKISGRKSLTWWLI